MKISRGWNVAWLEGAMTERMADEASEGRLRGAWDAQATLIELGLRS